MSDKLFNIKQTLFIVPITHRGSFKSAQVIVIKYKCFINLTESVEFKNTRDIKKASTNPTAPSQTWTFIEIKYLY